MLAPVLILYFVWLAVVVVVVLPCESFLLSPPTTTMRHRRPCSARGGAVDGGAGTTTNAPPAPTAAEPAAPVASTKSSSSCITIAGVECRPVIVSALNLTVLEASAEAQVMLVEAALDERGIDDDDDDVSSKTLPSGDPYGMVIWPAAVSLAQYLIGGDSSSNDDVTCSGKKRDLSTVRVWEVGSGTGVVSIAAARHGAKPVYATDYEALTLQLLEHAAYQMNGISPTQLSTGLWNIVMADEDDKNVSTTTNNSPTLPSLPPADLLVAADVLYEFRTGRGLADLAIRALRAGMDVLVADSPGRPGRPVFLDRVNQSLKVPVAFTTIPGSTITEARHDLICGVGSTTISETPKPLPIALLELHPAMLKED
jgi:predicted nicotinamide N-methyase